MENVARSNASRPLNEGADLNATPFPEMATSPDYPGMQPATPDDILAYYRTVYPFLPILPLPASIVTVVLAANVAQDITIPDGTALAAFRGNADYYVSWQGAATVPAAAALPYGEVISKAAFKPEYAFFMLANNRQLSIVAPGNAIVQVHCLPQFREPTWGHTI